MSSRRLQQHERPDDIGVDERRRAVDRSVDVRFSREVQDRTRRMPRERLAHRLPIGDVGLDEGETRIVEQIADVQAAARVGQFVDDDQPLARVAVQISHEVRTDKAGSAGHQQCVHVKSPCVGAIVNRVDLRSLGW